MISLLLSCSSKRNILEKRLHHTLDEVTWDQHFSGVLVVDLLNGDTLFKHNERRYFTPASNIKILTLYAALRNLPPRIPALQYLEKDSTLYFRGTADPSLLHPYFKDSTSIRFLSQYDSLIYVEDTFEDTPLGPGWAWEDFDAGYAPERAPLPLYGNVLSVYPGRASEVQPKLFSTKVNRSLNNFRRSPDSNHFYIVPAENDTLEVPFMTSTALTLSLLEEALGKKPGYSDQMPEGPIQTLYGMDRDSLLRRMMVESDNFLAEQLLLSVALQLQGKMDSRKAIQQLLSDDLEFMPDAPRWVDGSGLSRYNLVTPASIVSILTRLGQEYDLDTVMGLFPVGGVSGTLKDWYAGNDNAYVYAKSGTLGNNYNLSGYLITKRGRILVFSLMNNHFLRTQYEIRSETEALLQILRDHY